MSSSSLQASTPPGELRRALEHGLDLPAVALRASMETLARDMQEGAPGQRLLEGALSEVDRLIRNVEQLVQYVMPEPTQPMRCTAQELVKSALRGLSAEHRARVLTAIEVRDAILYVDAPLLSTNLHRLLENALEDGHGRVLLSIRETSETIELHVLSRTQGELDSSWSLEAFHSTRPNQLGLGLTIARRDAERMGGQLFLELTEHHRSHAWMSLPRNPKSQRSA